MRIIFVTLVSMLCLYNSDTARAQAPFYQDKTITVVLGGPPAGSADLRTRGVINILRKHIPGNPTIVMQYMGAGGGRQAANHVYGVAKPDGLTIGSMGAALVTNAVLGATGVQYDIDKLIYLGTPDSAQHYLSSPTATPASTPLKNFARRRECGSAANPSAIPFTLPDGSSLMYSV